MDFEQRLKRACPGWCLRYDPAAGYWLTPPDGDEALITTGAALEAWLVVREAEAQLKPERAPAELTQEELFDAAA